MEDYVEDLLIIQFLKITTKQSNAYTQLLLALQSEANKSSKLGLLYVFYTVSVLIENAGALRKTRFALPVSNSS